VGCYLVDAPDLDVMTEMCARLPPACTVGIRPLIDTDDDVASPAEASSAQCGNHRLPATRAELLSRLGEQAATDTADEEATALCGNAVERAHLVARRARLG